MARKTAQYFLVDLVAIIAGCGLVFSLLKSLEQPTRVAVLIIFLSLVFGVWKYFWAIRNAPICDECGKRFITQQKKRALLPICPQCGHQRRRSNRMRTHLAIGFWGLLALVVLVVVLMTSLSLVAVSSLSRDQVKLYFIVLPILMILLIGLWTLFLIALALYDYGLSKTLPCEKCGATISSEHTTGPLICPRCRLRSLPRSQAEIDGVRAMLVLFSILLFVGMLAGLILSEPVSSLTSLSPWILVPLSIVATVVVFFAALLGRIIFRTHRLKDEAYLLKRAARCAGEDGGIVRSGTTTIWWSGPKNPAPQMLEQMEAARRGLQTLTASEIAAPPFLRILFFHNRSGFDAFVAPLAIAVSYYIRNVSSFYLGAPHRVLNLCDEKLTYALSDVNDSFRQQICSHLMESLPGSPLASWLREAVVKRLSNADHDPGSVNRKMIAALSKGTTLGAHLFEIKPPELFSQLRRFSDHQTFQKVIQFQAESWSVFEYLGGKHAPQERHDCLRAFLNDKKGQEEPAATFERHFGFGLDQLVENWRQWVRDQGVSNFSPPPAHAEEGLLNRLIPLVENRQANAQHRILAIRQMGSHGYALGADALIGLLGSDSAIPTHEITWALEAISGMAFSDDKGRWEHWCNSLPAEIRQGHHQNKHITAGTS